MTNLELLLTLIKLEINLLEFEQQVFTVKTNKEEKEEEEI